MKYVCLVCLLAGSVLFSACGAAHSERVAAAQALQGDPVRGKPLYTKHCGSCHGANGKSGSEGIDVVRYLNAGDANYLDVVLYGVDDMPGFADELSDQDAADLVQYVHTL